MFLSGALKGNTNPASWIIDWFNELIVDFLSQLGLFLDSTQPQPLKIQNRNIFLDQTNEHEVNTRPATEHLQTAGSFKFMAGVPL